MPVAEEDHDGPEWRARLARCVSLIQQWSPVLPSLAKVHPRSALATDQSGNPTMPVQTLAWAGMIAAIEHLEFVSQHASDVLSRRAATRPTAVFPVTRAALVGSSQAVWLLAPDDSDQRVRRGLVIAAQEHRDHGDFLADYLEGDSLEGEFTETVLASGRRHLAEIRGRQKAAERLLGGRPPSATSMMRQAAEHLSATGMDDPWQRRALTYEWRLSSAAAHTRLWPLFVRPTDRVPMPDEFGEERTLTSSIRDYTQSIGSAVLMTSEALRLWRLRAGRPDAGAAFGATL